MWYCSIWQCGWTVPCPLTPSPTPQPTWTPPHTQNPPPCGQHDWWKTRRTRKNWWTRNNWWHYWCKVLRTAVALSTASCLRLLSPTQTQHSFVQWFKQNPSCHTMLHQARIFWPLCQNWASVSLNKVLSSESCPPCLMYFAPALQWVEPVPTQCKSAERPFLQVFEREQPSVDFGFSQPNQLVSSYNLTTMPQPSPHTLLNADLKRSLELHDTQC